MPAPTDEGKLSAWERWEMADFGTPPQKKINTPQPVEEPAIKLPTVEEVEQIRRQAHEDGQRSGYVAGQVAARQEAERIGQAATRLEQAMSNLDQEVAEELLALAVEIARQVVRREITAKPGAILEVVREALNQLPHQHAFIYLNPEDASLVRSYLGDTLTHAGHRIHEDAKLQRGDCLIEAGGSHVEGTVATRWRRVLEGMGIESAWDESPT
jgi:flagellar assembly protein FliH